MKWWLEFDRDAIGCKLLTWLDSSMLLKNYVLFLLTYFYISAPNLKMHTRQKKEKEMEI